MSKSYQFTSCLSILPNGKRKPTVKFVQTLVDREQLDLFAVVPGGAK